MRTIIFIHFVLLNILSFSISAQPIFEKPQIQGTVLEEFSSVDEYSGWIYFKEQSNIKAEDFFTNYKDVFSLSNSDEMILEKKEDESDLEGYSQYRYKQLYEDIEVERSGYVIRTKNGVAYVAYGKLVRDLNLELSNVIPEKTALENALYEINASKYAWEDEEWESGIKNDSNESKTTWYPKGELKITPINTDDWSKENYRLAYFFSITTLKPTYDTYGVYIDASSGDFIKMKSLKKYDYCAIGTTNTVFDGNNISINTMYRSSYNDYILQDECRGGTFTVKNYTGGFWTLLPKIYQPTNVWGSPTYKSQATCLWAVEKAWDYYSNIHGRNGMSNSNRDIHIWYDTDLNSAGYNKRTFYDEIFVGPNWEDLDIIGHEFTHGVIAHTTELDGNNSEADALDESYADIFGVLIEDYVKGGLDWNYGDHFRSN